MIRVTFMNFFYSICVIFKDCQDFEGNIVQIIIQFIVII